MPGEIDAYTSTRPSRNCTALAPLSLCPTWKSFPLGDSAALHVARPRAPDTAVTVLSFESSNTSTSVRRPSTLLADTTRCLPRVCIRTGADVVSKTVISPSSPVASRGGSGAVKYATPLYVLDAKYTASPPAGLYRIEYRPAASVST